MNKRSLLIAICSLLLASCPEPYSPTENTPAIPPGMGAFYLSLGDLNMRTIMPESGLEHFKEYTLSLYNSVDSAYIKLNDFKCTPENYSDPVYLKPDNYWLKVTAWADTGGEEKAAEGEAHFTIKAGKPETVSIYLKPIKPDTAATGSGTFTWDITLPAGLSAASMTIRNVTSGTVVQTINLLGTAPPDGKKGSLTLSSAYYRVIFELKKDDNTQSVVIREVLHIYQNLESKFTYTFTDAHFNNILYTVRLVYGNGSSDGEVSCLHGKTVQLSDPVKTANTYLYPETPPVIPGFIFAGWYTDSALTAAWSADTPITGDTTLYAKYTGAIDISSQSGSNDFAKAIAYVNANADATKSYTLLVGEDVSVGTYTLNSNFNLTIRGYDGARTITYSNNGGYIFNINAGATLTLGENITLKSYNGLIGGIVNVAGTLVMDTGSKITGISTRDNGVGVCVSVNAGTFKMNGGEISGDKVQDSSAVKIINNGKFNMTGGKITGHTSGAVNVNSGTFTMTGGEISGNTSTINGGGVYVQGGFTVGGTAVVKGNTVSSADTTLSNVHLADGTYITLGTGANAPASGMEIWVQTATTDGVIVQSGASAAIAGYFHSDDAGKIVVLSGNQLKIEDELPISGSGTATDPFVVRNEEGLNKIGTDGYPLDGHYKQGTNIVLAKPATGASNWTPIGGGGSSSGQFTGTYDGGGKTITGLVVSSTAQNQGMFGYIGSGGKVENVALVGVDISGEDYVGGIAGTNEGTISKCYVTGSVKTAGSNCFSVGGVAGLNKGTLENCYTNVTVLTSTGNKAGGIVGDNIGNGIVQFCYAAGTVSGQGTVGGIVGHSESTSTLKNCIALNSLIEVTNGGTNLGGRVVGNDDFGNNTLSSNYAWSGMKVNSSTVTSNVGGTSKNGADLPATDIKTQSYWTTAGFTFGGNGPWVWNDSSGMPSLSGGAVLQWPGYLQ